MREIEITIDVDGQIDIDLKGYQGKNCHVDAEAFAKVFGQVVKSDKKCEYWQTQVNTQQHNKQ